MRKSIEHRALSIELIPLSNHPQPSFASATGGSASGGKGGLPLFTKEGRGEIRRGWIRGLRGILFASCILHLASDVFAVNNPAVGTVSSQFLKLGVNARAIAMGDAYSTVAEDSSALYWNPAGLGALEKKSLLLMHAVYLSNIFYDYGSYAHPLNKIGTFGVSVQYLSAPNMNLTGDSGEILDTFRPYDLAFTLGYGKLFKGKGFGGLGGTALGAGMKVIQSKIVESAHTFAADVGFLWLISNQMRFGMSAQNIGGTLKFAEKNEDLPFNLKLGSYYKPLKPLLFALDLNIPKDNDPYLGFGAEYKKLIFQEISLAGRAGFNSRTTADIYGLTSLSSGIGFGWKNFELDFAWVPFGGLGNSYRFSLTSRF